MQIGAPLAAFLVVGTYGVSKLLAGKYDTNQAKLKYRPDDMPKQKQTEEKFDLNKELEVLPVAVRGVFSNSRCNQAMDQQLSGWDKYEIKRVPRPDDPPQKQSSKSGAGVAKGASQNSKPS